MRTRLLMAGLVVGLVALAGCLWPPAPSHHKFPSFVTVPKDMTGYGADCFWLYVDAEQMAETMVLAGVNCTHAEVFNCSPSKAQSQSADPSPHGFWTIGKFDSQLKAPLDKFLKTMYDHRITVVLTLFGGHDMSGVQDADLLKLLAFLNGRPTGHTGIMLCLAAEPGPGSPKEKFDRLTQLMDANWAGMKAWNYGTRPHAAPGGYWVEYHPQAMSEYGPAGANFMVLTDSAVWFGLNVDGSLQSKVDPNKVRPYARAVKSGGNGFLYYGQRFTGWDLDVLGIQAIGSAMKTPPTRMERLVEKSWQGSTNDYFYLPMRDSTGGVHRIRMKVCTNAPVLLGK